jgi:methionyl-tRNA synthetase
MPKFLITSAIPYVNGVKHLGNLVGSLLPADVHARFRRQLGDEVLFICGTDEHGTPTELAAAAADLPIGEFCVREHVRQANIYRRFGLSFDYFGRSSSPENHALTQHFFRCLDAAGLIEEREVQQVWSPRDRRFLPDRYVLGICPHCGSPDACGDQCDACGRLLDPPDLIHAEAHGSIHHLQCLQPYSDDVWPADGVKVDVDETAIASRPAVASAAGE